MKNVTRTGTRQSLTAKTASSPRITSKWKHTRKYKSHSRFCLLHPTTGAINSPHASCYELSLVLIPLVDGEISQSAFSHAVSKQALPEPGEIRAQLLSVTGWRDGLAFPYGYVRQKTHAEHDVKEQHKTTGNGLCYVKYVKLYLYWWENVTERNRASA